MVPWCNIYLYAVDHDSFNIIIDKNSLWDGLNIQKLIRTRFGMGQRYKKGNCVSRKFLAQDVGVVWGAVLRGGGWFSRGKWGRALLTIGRGLAGDFEVQPGTPVPSTLSSSSYYD